MIRLSPAEFDAHQKRLAEMKARANVTTHVCSDEEVLGFGQTGVQGADRRRVDAGPAGRMKAPQNAPKSRQRSKHGAVKTVVDGERFDSKLEMNVWQALRLREIAGQIRNLRRQVKFSLFMTGGEHYGIYTADFVFDESGDARQPWRRVIADAKSPHTRTLPAWQKVKLLMQNNHGIYVRELP